MKAGAMQDLYALKKFQLAVIDLAMGTSLIQIKLAKAYVDHIMHIDVDHISEDLRAEFVELKKRLAAISFLSQDWNNVPIINIMTEDTAQTLAKQIVEMCFRISREYVE
jgi:hypothetical protein